MVLELLLSAVEIGIMTIKCRCIIKVTLDHCKKNSYIFNNNLNANSIKRLFPPTVTTL